MISLINIWTRRIIIAVIISIIIEMILPNGEIKKYVRSVIGIYVAFVVISPIFTVITGNKISLNTNLIYSNNTYEMKSIDTNKYIENVYIENLKADIKNNVIKKGYTVVNLEVDINSNNEIEKIELIVKNNGIENIEEVKIEINKEIEETNCKQEDLLELKVYLSKTYDIPEERISLYAKR